MPTMTAAFAHEPARGAAQPRRRSGPPRSPSASSWRSSRRCWWSSRSSRVVRRVGFAPFAWYRIAARRARCCSRHGRALVVVRRRCSGFAAASSPASSSRCRWSSASRRSSGSSGWSTASSARSTIGQLDSGATCPGSASLTTALLVLLVGALATNVIGKRLLQRAEGYLLHVPVFRTIYAPVKQLVVAFSPDNEYGFKRVVLVEDRARGFVLGFLTQGVHRRSRPGARGADRRLRADQPPLSRRRRDLPRATARRFPDITVEQGIRIFLTGGMALSAADAGAARRRSRRRLPSMIRAVFGRDRVATARSQTVCTTGIGRACRGDDDRDVPFDASGAVLRAALLLTPVPRAPRAAAGSRRAAQARRRRARRRRGEPGAAGPGSGRRSCGINGRTLLMGGLVVCVLGLRSAW